jgi:hypothetical protein
MADGRKNNGGARKGAGNPGFGKVFLLKENVEKFSPIFWDELNKMVKTEYVMPKFVQDFINDLKKTKRIYEAKQLIEMYSKIATDNKRFALSEFNKIQVKMIPQDITSGGEKLELGVILDMCDRE